MARRHRLQHRHHRQRRRDAGEVPRAAARIGSVEESFIARLRPGDCFLFAGRLLEYVRTQDMTAYVRAPKASRASVPAGTARKMPLSTELADAVRASVLAGAAQGDFFEPRVAGARGRCWRRSSGCRSCRRRRHLLVERFRSREGQHLFLYPFAGRNVHLGLASLLAWRLAKHAAEHLLHLDQRLRPRAAERAAGRPGRRCSTTACCASGDLLHDVLASLNCERAGAAALSRDRARRRPGLHRLSRPAEERAPAAGLERAVLRGVPQVRRRPTCC